MPNTPNNVDDDLFGDTPAPAAESNDQFPGEIPSQPSNDGLADDIFGDEPTPSQPAPPSQPAAADDSEFDDLFGDEPATSGVAPAAEAPIVPADDSEFDDLFGDEPAGAAPIDPSDNEGFEEDLFNDKEADTMDSEFEDLFGARPSSEITRTISFVSVETPIRAWLDNTGMYRTVGRLSEIGSNFVRLAKTNARTCTVSFDRLSDEDLVYVRQQVERYKESIKVAAK